MQLPEGYSFRKLQLSDYSKNYIETLKILTTVGDITPNAFDKLYKHWQEYSEIYYPHVITDGSDTVVATGMLLVERKLIHECGLVGHVEDIAVAESEQGKKLGHALISGLTEIAKEKGCYKVILDCSPHNEPFYEKCGYQNKGTEMEKRF
ncbi:uncharacterized protein PRCAT00005929001 [Priceomyces carsonii]|uniref:uncharacterized protein n=1 Tax=Priceomyces carsonii TaxID=28549 RepID=UPI002ED90D85|nr:unnamed protein product [Priceomyces carsonii]